MLCRLSVFWGVVRWHTAGLIGALWDVCEGAVDMDELLSGYWSKSIDEPQD